MCRYLEHFHLSGLKFGSLKVDTCGICDEFSVKIEAAEGETKEELYKKHQEHLQEADCSYQLRKQDQENALQEEVEVKELPMELRSSRGLAVITTDFMANIMLPKLSAGETFYLCHLKLFNYGIHVGSLDQHSMYFWGEREGRTTSNDILSAVHTELNERATGRETLHWWSDNTKESSKMLANCPLLR